MPADEFDIIKRLFAPLAGDGARGLIDDAALFAGHVVTTDALVEGVHFLPDDPIDTIAKKALRVNVSDLTAKGAKPVAVLLSLIWPNDRPAEEITDFARGLGEDLAHFGIALLGGDTTATPGPLTISITTFGAPLSVRTPSRADAEAGQHLWVTGVIGDGFLGLKSLTEPPAIAGAAPGDRSDLHAAYRTPSPPVRFAEAIAAYAAASMDVSDGLIADAAKLALASNVAMRIDAEAVPLSAAGHAYVAARGEAGLIELLTGGDDYQVLFTARRDARGRLLEAARATETNLALLGDVVLGSGIRLVGGSGTEIVVAASGHAHRLGR